MSHFTTIVFAKTMEEAKTLMAPFNEQIDVPEYDKGQVEAERIESFVKWFNEQNPANNCNTIKEMYDTVFCCNGETKSAGEHWNFGKWRWPDSKKQDGAPHEFTTYNPKSKWDWCEVGGRWDKAIPGNACTVKRIPKDFRPFAFLTPDGEWHDKGKMHWFTITTDEKPDEEWQAEWEAAKRDMEAAGNKAFLMDCHI